MTQSRRTCSASSGVSSCLRSSLVTALPVGPVEESPLVFVLRRLLPHTAVANQSRCSQAIGSDRLGRSQVSPPIGALPVSNCLDGGKTCPLCPATFTQ